MRKAFIPVGQREFWQEDSAHSEINRILDKIIEKIAALTLPKIDSRRGQV